MKLAVDIEVGIEKEVEVDVLYIETVTEVYHCHENSKESRGTRYKKWPIVC
jgi:hypothetical protein